MLQCPPGQSETFLMSEKTSDLSIWSACHFYEASVNNVKSTNPRILEASVKPVPIRMKPSQVPQHVSRGTRLGETRLTHWHRLKIPTQTEVKRIQRRVCKGPLQGVGNQLLANFIFWCGTWLCRCIEMLWNCKKITIFFPVWSDLPFAAPWHKDWPLLYHQFLFDGLIKTFPFYITPSHSCFCDSSWRNFWQMISHACTSLLLHSFGVSST